MAGLSTGLKGLLKITACKLESNGQITPQTGSANSFEVMLNPSGFNHEHSISYSESSSDSRCSGGSRKPMGQPSVEPKFYKYNPEKVSFEILIDGTGVVNLPVPGLGSPPVKDQIKKLKGIVYKYEGSEHEPNIVRLTWGTSLFDGRMESMSIEYTMFKPSGEPLRAKVKLGFVNYMSKAEQSLVAKKSSPDLTHTVEVRAGDSLPLLCYRIYKDCSYYTEVARINELDNFRDLRPGMILCFPPVG